MRIFLCGIILCYLYIETNADDFKALFLNPNTNSIMYLPDNVVLPKNCESWTALCPAKIAEEQAFNEKFSLNKLALFVQQQRYNEEGMRINLDKYVCQQPVSLSVAFHDKSKIYEFGYEIYPPDYDSDLYQTIPQKEFYSMDRMKETMTYKGTFQEALRTLKTKRADMMLGKITMAFTWIPLFKAKLTYERFEYVEYEIRKNNIDPTPSCHDFSLGNQILYEKKVDELYSDDTQKNIFENVELPESTSEKFQESACTTEFKCLKKWSLVPSDHFQFGPSSTPLTCSNMTTVPIWSSTLEGIMLKLDKYLYTLRRISKQPLRIFAGVIDNLSLPRKKYFGDKDIILKARDNYLKIIVPKIIYKIVKLKLNPCESNEKCWYGVLIVIHNDPNFTPDKKICEDISGELGWEEIRYETWSNLGAQSKHIYVCEISKDTIKSTKMTYKKELGIQKLSLLQFPYKNEEKKLSFKLIKDKIYNELERLSRPGETVELKNDAPMERPAFDNNFDFAGDNEVVYSDDEDSRKSDSDTKVAED